MKLTALLVSSVVLAIATISAAPPPAAKTPTVQDMFEAGRAAFYRDDYATAKRLLTAVNKADPNHRPTQILLKNISLAEAAEVVKKNSLEGRLQRMIIPRLDLEEAKVTEVLDFLQLKSGELGGAGAKPNFIVKLDEATGRQTVTLRLHQVSVFDALRALATTSGIDVSYDKFAVLVRTKADAAAAAPAVPATAPGATPAASGSKPK